MAPKELADLEILLFEARKKKFVYCAAKRAATIYNQTTFTYTIESILPA